MDSDRVLVFDKGRLIEDGPPRNMERFADLLLPPEGEAAAEGVVAGQ